VKGGCNIKYYKEIIISLNLILLLGFGCLFIYKSFYLESNEEDSDVALANNEVIKEKTETSSKINVEIKGAVEKPGVYNLTTTNIINDLVTIAGGFKENAYTDNINLSKKMEDQMVVYVYTKKEYAKLNVKEKPSEIKTCKCPDIDISKCIDTGKSVIENKPGSEVSAPNNEEVNNSTETSLVNINNANITELMTLNGIGEAKAKAIVEYREANGNFVNLEDIKNVSGISDTIYDKIKNYITI